MTKTNTYYFKKTFYLVFTISSVFMLVRGLFDIDYSTESLYKLLFTSLLAGIITEALLGLINMFWLKKENFFLAKK